MKQDRETQITVQVDPRMDIISFCEDELGREIFRREAEMILDVLYSIQGFPQEAIFSLYFRNDDFGEGVKYPFVEVGGEHYFIELLNVC